MFKIVKKYKISLPSQDPVSSERYRTVGPLIQSYGHLAWGSKGWSMFRPSQRYRAGCCEDVEQKNHKMRSFKSSENIHKKEGGSYYVVSANKASSVTL